MAGDIGIEESIAAPTAATLREASVAPPIPVLHDYGPDFRIRIGPAPATAREAAPLNRQPLSENERLGLAALELRQSSNTPRKRLDAPIQTSRRPKGVAHFTSMNAPSSAGGRHRHAAALKQASAPPRAQSGSVAGSQLE